jgi:hypothetical protein
LKLRATLGALALVSSACVLQAAPAMAGHDLHKRLDSAVHRVVSHVLCPLEWFRHRHHHAHVAYTPAPKKVVYAKKTYAKKVHAKKVAAAPLK